MLKKADVAIGAKVANVIKKDDFWDKVENIMRVSQLIEKIANLASTKHPVVCLKSVSLI